MKLTILAACAVLAAGVPSIAEAATTLTVDQSNLAYDPMVSVSQGVGNTTARPIGQTFMPTFTGIDFATFALRNNVRGAQPVNVSVSLYQGDYSQAAVLLATTNLVTIPVLSADTFFEFDFASRVLLIPGATYTLQLNQVENVDSASVIENSNGYSRGTLLNGRMMIANGDTVFSEGVFGAATPAVPEPATWAMMLVGFGAMGVAMRRRAKVSAVRFA